MKGDGASAKRVCPAGESQAPFRMGQTIINRNFAPVLPFPCMAKKRKSPKASPPPSSPSRRRQWRLGFGFLFLLLGIYSFFSFVSYLFTWTADQDQLVAARGLGDYLFTSDQVAANWGGRLGAFLSHVFLFEGVGLA